MYKKAADSLQEIIKKELEEGYTIEDMLRLQVRHSLITPKSAEEFNVRSEFNQIKEKQSQLPKEQQESDRSIMQDIAARNNCSPSRVYYAIVGRSKG